MHNFTKSPFELCYDEIARVAINVGKLILELTTMPFEDIFALLLSYAVNFPRGEGVLGLRVPGMCGLDPSTLTLGETENLYFFST